MLQPRGGARNRRQGPLSSGRAAHAPRTVLANSQCPARTSARWFTPSQPAASKSYDRAALLEWRQQADAPPILSASPPTSGRALRQNWLSCAAFERPLLPSFLCAVACIAVAHLALFESWWPSQWPWSSAAEPVAGLKARNAQLARENDELKKRLATAGRDQRQYTGSLAGFDRHPLVAPTRGQSPPTTKPPRPAPRPTASRSPPTAIALAADRDFHPKLGAMRPTVRVRVRVS